MISVVAHDREGKHVGSHLATTHHDLTTRLVGCVECCFYTEA